MRLFENTVILRGFLDKDAEVPSSEAITDDAYAILTLCVESGVWWRPAIMNGSHTLHCLPWPFLCGFTRGMKQGEYTKVNGRLVILRYRSLNLTSPVYEVHAKQIRRLEIPVDGVVEKYNG